MKEDFLHYLWKFQKFNTLDFFSTNQKPIQVIKQGIHNQENPGPDFFNAQLVIDSQKWAGNVEIHLKSSDWYAHNHHNDLNYDSVVLHVVWEDDVSVFRSDESQIPCLELKPYVDANLLVNYQSLIYNNKSWLKCSNSIANVSSFEWENWLERLYFERLEHKIKPINALLHSNINDWEATLFCLLAKSFGGNINGAFFFKMAQSFPYAIIRKATKVIEIEALFVGQLNMLDFDTNDAYEKELVFNYQFLKSKYSLKPLVEGKPQFFRLRPNNFPTIRLSQLAVLVVKSKSIFSSLASDFSFENFRNLIEVGVSEYWITHFTFGKESKPSSKKLSNSFCQVVYINSITPLMFLYRKLNSQEFDAHSIILNEVTQLSKENNSKVKVLEDSGVNIKNSMESQAILTLYNDYCIKGRCLSCKVVNQVVS